MPNGKCRKKDEKLVVAFHQEDWGWGGVRWKILTVTAHGFEYLLQARHGVWHFPYHVLDGA